MIVGDDITQTKATVNIGEKQAAPVEEEQRNERYWRKVSKIYRAVGCSHHPQDALKLVQKNDWSSSGIPPDYFVEDASFGVIPAKSLEKLSPRQRIAYETLRKWFMAAPALAYVGGRAIRHGHLPSVDETNVNSLDTIIFEASADHCVGVCGKKAYAIEFPFSATLDKVVGGLAGVVMSPIAFVAGLVYTPKEKQEPRKVTQ